MWLCFLILFINLVDGRSVDAIYLSNTAVKSGNKFSFICGTLSDGVTPQWKFRQENTYGELSLYNGTHIMDAFQDFAVVTTAKGISTLVKNTSWNEDAGTYICIERKKSDSIATISSAQLIVLDNDPVCKVSKENMMIGEHLQMECIVNYYGSIFPVFKWSRSDGINLVAHDYMNTSAVVSNLTTLVTIKEHFVTFMARIYFNQPLSSINTNGVHKATNAPNYEFTWTHKPNVLYAPRSVVITQKKDVYSIGDILLCVADGNPNPSYEWTELESSIVISHLPSLIIDGVNMENHVYKCTTRNNVSGQETPSVWTTVTIHAVRRTTKTGFDPVRSVTILAGVVCVILSIVAFAIALRRLKGCVRSCRLRDSVAGPDIVQNGDREENDRLPVDNAQEYIGYAQPDDLGLRVNAHGSQASVIDGCPVYDEINNSQGHASARKDVKHPVYGKMNKFSKDAAQTPSQEEYPVYGKVQKKNEQASYSGKANSTPHLEKYETNETLESESCYSLSLKKVRIGADGTEYMDLSEARRLMQSESAASSVQHPSFNRSQYAEIDHTKSTSK